VTRKLARGRLVGFFSELPRCVVAMEACPSAHHWGRQLLALGFEVRLIPPAHVKPYVRRNKNDAVDAAAICEAGGAAGPAVRAGAVDRQPGRVDAPSGPRVARRPADGGDQRVARSSSRDRRHCAAGRADAYTRSGWLVVEND
jgi:hypothetical protein